MDINRPVLPLKGPLFTGLEPSFALKVTSALKSRRFEEGTLLFSQGEPGEAMFLIQEGKVRIFRPGDEGKEKTLTVLGPGDTFGEMALLDGLPRSASAETLSASILLTLARQDFLPLLDNAVFCRRVITLLSERLRETNQQVESLVSSGARTRLASALHRLLGDLKNGGHYPATLGVSHQELADWCGLNRETVTRILGEWENQGLVSTGRRKLILLKPFTGQE